MTIRYLPFLLALVSPIAGLNNGVGKLPALGWNSWNAYRCDISEKQFLDAAQKIVSLGLKDAGYQYVNIDDCWSVKSGRDKTTNRLVPDPTKFPDGIKGTAAKIHALGLKIGIYSSAGTTTCAGYPASIGHETIDAETWAEWGIDYLKYDNCNIPSNWADVCSACVPDGLHQGPFPNGTCHGLSGNWCPASYDYTKSRSEERYRIMRDALLATKRPILYSLCNQGMAGVEIWGNATGNSWRSTDDIQPSWPRILDILNQNSFYMNHVNFWGHPDPDMLEVGNGLTPAQTRTHFALWAAMKSPLLIGTNLANIAKSDVDILKNRYLLAFNQDSVYGAPAKPYKWGTNPNWTFNASYPAEYWAGPSQQGTLVLVMNVYPATQTRRVVWAEVPGLKANTSYHVTDVWTGKSLGCFKNGISLNISSHDTGAIIVSRQGCSKRLR